MPLPALDDADARVDCFLDHVTAPLRTPSQRATFAEYAMGLLSDAERKSMEPLAAQARPDQAGGAHKAFVYLTGTAVWDDRAVRRHAAAWALWGMTASREVAGTILDDTGMLKQGSHSVGVARQYTGAAGKITNCQIAVTLAVFTPQHALPIDAMLYLPESWTTDPERRREARIPDEIPFRTKGEIALAMLKAAREDGVPLGKILLGDADYGRLWELRQWCREVGLRYGLGIHSTQKVWDAAGIWLSPMTVAEYAACVPKQEFRRIEWRTGANGKRLSARFAFLRVQVTRNGAEPVRGQTPEEWLVIEWRDGEAEPQHFSLCDLPAETSRTKLVGAIKERWRIEQVHQELKGEVGFDHFEGRSWPGWQHHVTLALSCHALLIGERCVAFPPRAPRGAPARSDHRAPRTTRLALRSEHATAPRAPSS
ncbi:MAG: IS701 family transposase [Polyangiales bacterium]